MSTTKESIIDTTMRDMGWATSDTKTRVLVDSWFDQSLERVLGSWNWPHRTAVRTLSFRDSYWIGTGPFIWIPGREVVLGPDVTEVRSVRTKVDRKVLRRVTVEELFEQGKDLSESGDPTHWYYGQFYPDLQSAVYNSGQGVELWPVPVTGGADLDIEFFVDLGAPTPLAEADAIPLPQVLLNALREGIKAKALHNTGQAQEALVFEQKFDLALEEYKQHSTLQASDSHVMQLDGDLQSVGMYRRASISEVIPYE